MADTTDNAAYFAPWSVHVSPVHTARPQELQQREMDCEEPPSWNESGGGETKVGRQLSSVQVQEYARAVRGGVQDPPWVYHDHRASDSNRGGCSGRGSSDRPDKKVQAESGALVSRVHYRLQSAEAGSVFIPSSEEPRLREDFHSSNQCDRGVGAVLSQSGEDGDISQKLLPRERKYATVEKECLAVKLGIQTFHVYLISRPFMIQTDHWSLEWLDRANPCLTCWSLMLQAYAFTVEYRAGKKKGNADGLSRQWDGRGKGCGGLTLL